jgi:hypothetical protein
MHAPEETFTLIDGADGCAFGRILRIAYCKDLNALAISNECINDSMKPSISQRCAG